MKGKIIYAKTKVAFENKLQETDPNVLSHLSPLVFIEDTREVWINGTYFNVGTPGVSVSEQNDIITVGIGPNGFTMSSSGDNIVIRKGTGNNIIFSSPSLSSIDAQFPLKWDSTEKKLFHEESDVEQGNYGQTNESDNVSLLTIPWFSVDKWGHLLQAENRNVKIRDYVEQLSSDILTGKHNLLVGYSPHGNSETQPIRKASGITYDSITKKLEIEGGIEAKGASLIQGDFTVIDGQIIGDVKGNITGTATPKIHLSEDPEYGGASLNLYGHVKLQDKFNGVPAPSSDNSDKDSNMIRNGVAASPKLVWDVKEELEQKIEAVDKIQAISVNGVTVNKEDFPDELKITTEGGLMGGINPTTGEITFSAVQISGFNEKEDEILLEDELEFTKDFEIINNKVSLSWKLIK